MELETLTVEQLNAIWDLHEGDREDQTKRFDYYDGDQAIVGVQEYYSDGTPKAQVVTNWIKYIVNRYVGSISDLQISNTIVLGEEPEDLPDRILAVDAYSTLVKDQNLTGKDNRLEKDCQLAGYGVEVHSFDEADGIQITIYDPREWVLVRDTDDKLVLAIRRVTLKANTIHGGVYLDKPLEIMTVYYPDVIIVYSRTEKDSVWTEVDEPISHSYGEIPVVQWSMNDTRTTIITDAIITQQDEFNTIDSANGEEVKKDVDSILHLTNVGADWAKENESTIRKQRIVVTPENSDAKFLTHVSDVARINNRLGRTRSHIHMMGEVPDVANMVGATGSTSGIALKLMFTPMEESVQGMIPYLEQSVRKRIDLINAIFRKQNKPEIVDYKVTIQFLIPVNRIEEWQHIGSLDNIVSQRTQLELLTDIDDPETELKAVRLEQPDIPDTPLTAQENVRRVDARAARNEAGTEEVILGVSDRVTDELQRQLS